MRSFRELLLFIMFFGHLIAGPIMRGREFFPQLHVLPGPTASQVRAGVLLLIAGLIKKVVFADELLAGRVDVLFAAGGDLGRLYRYAVEHGDDLSYIPCFCGCYRFGHQSNHDCYIKASHPDGTLTFTSHAAT